MSKALGGLLAILAILFLCIALLFQFAVYLVATSGVLALGANFLFGPGTAQASYNTIVIVSAISSMIKVVADGAEGME